MVIGYWQDIAYLLFAPCRLGNTLFRRYVLDVAPLLAGRIIEVDQAGRNRTFSFDATADVLRWLVLPVRDPFRNAVRWSYVQYPRNHHRHTRRCA